MPDSSPHSERIREVLLRGAYEPEAAEWRAFYGPQARDEAIAALDSLIEQLEALRDAAERVVQADNQSLGAMGQEGERAMVEMTDALNALRVLLLESNPAKERDA